MTRRFMYSALSTTVILALTAQPATADPTPLRDDIQVRHVVDLDGGTFRIARDPRDNTLYVQASNGTISRVVMKSPTDAVGETIAQGRIWSGQRALELGLIDRLGGLETAINLAMEKAGIPANQPIEIIERPEPELFSFSLLQPRLIERSIQRTPALDHLQFRLEHNGLPLLLVPPSHLPGPISWPYGEHSYEQ